jgi:hypothetical protein
VTASWGWLRARPRLRAPRRRAAADASARSRCSNATAIERHDRAATLLRRGVDAFPKDVRLLTRLGDALWCARAAAQHLRGSRFSPWQQLTRRAAAAWASLATPCACWSWR